MRSIAPAIAATTLAVLAACGGVDDLPRSVQTAGHSTTPGDPQALHGGAPLRIPSHHVMVALFDAGTGTRFTNARVRARVGEGSPAKALEPMEVNGMMSYGNFFEFGGGGLQRIRLEILLAGRPSPTEAEFAYEHQPGT